MGNINDKHERFLIDPDIVSILSVCASGLGAICSLYQVYLMIDNIEKKEDAFKTELRGFRRDVREVNRTLRFFEAQVEELERFLKRVNRRGEEQRNIFELPFKFGEIRVYLYPIEIDHFIRIQDAIYESLRNYSIRLTTMAQFLSTYQQEMSSEQRIMFESELEMLVESFNRIKSTEVNLAEFITRLKRIITYIHKLIKDLEYTYSDLIWDLI